jgi:hypothetical protein
MWQKYDAHHKPVQKQRYELYNTCIELSGYFSINYAHTVRILWTRTQIRKSFKAHAFYVQELVTPIEMRGSFTHQILSTLFS